LLSTTDKIHRKINLKEERLVLTHGFRGFGPWSLGFIVSGHVTRQNVMTESAKLWISWKPGSKERERAKEESCQGETTPSKGMAQVTYFFQLGSTF
jgi:hypothetical protein